jgi:hypothetical protein
VERQHTVSDDAPKNQLNWLDKHMQSLIGDGNVSHLSGSGKRLVLDEDSHIPEAHRLANRVMKDNNVLPPWMQLGQELDDERDSLLSRLTRLARTYRGQLADAERANNNTLTLEIEAWWHTACQRVRENIREYNRRILTYNISLPSGLDQRLQLHADEEIRKALARRDMGIDVRLSS